MIIMRRKKDLAPEAVVDDGKNKIGDEVHTKQNVDDKKNRRESLLPESSIC